MDRASRIIAVSRRRFLGLGVGAPLLIGMTHKAQGIVGLVGGAARSVGQTFDFYISTTGNDANSGTLASPWAITSLQRANGNNARMKSKRVGLISGTYGVFSLWSSASYNDPALNVPSGTVSAWTYLGSSDINGFESPRAAKITASPSGTPGGGLPGTSSSSVSILGQSYTDAGGYAEINGVVVSDSNGYGIWVQGPTSTQGGPPFKIINCEVYNIGGSEGNNPGCIMQYFSSGNIISNNKLHDCTASGGQHNFAGIFSFNCSGNVYEYNTIYNCNSGIYDKNPDNGGHTYQYNYIEVNGALPYAAITDSTGDVLGQVHKCHHNIMIVSAGTGNNNGWLGSADINQLSYGSFQFYNNTVYAFGGNIQGSATLQTRGTTVSPAATVTHYNNIYGVTGSPGFFGNATFSSSSGAISLSDYNCYQDTTTACIGTGTYGSSTLKTLPNWQSSMSLDVHSIGHGSSASMFVNPGISLTPAGYQLQSGSPCKNTGSATGTSGGAAQDMGAWGYDPALGSPPSIIGSNF